MKTNPQIIWLSSLLLGFSLMAVLRSKAAEQTNNTPQRVGVYDSRAVAYAWFWTDDHQQQLSERKRAATEARAAGDVALAAKLEKALASEQEQIHHQVFGTAPSTEALAALESRLPKLKQQAGVSALISKWDTRTLAQLKGTEQIDVTDILVREFHPSEERLKIIAQIRAKQPPSSNQDPR